MKLEFGLEIKNQCKRCDNFKFYIEMDANHLQHKKYYCDVADTDFWIHSIELKLTSCKAFKSRLKEDKKI